MKTPKQQNKHQNTDYSENTRKAVFSVINDSSHASPGIFKNGSDYPG